MDKLCSNRILDLIKLYSLFSTLINLLLFCAVFADACLKGLNGVPDIVECSFVQSTVTELPFFASKVLFYCLGIMQLCGTRWFCQSKSTRFCLSLHFFRVKCLHRLPMFSFLRIIWLHAYSLQASFYFSDLKQVSIV